MMLYRLTPRIPQKTQKRMIEYWPMFSALGGFVIAQILNYMRMRHEHEAMMKSINGIGAKLASFGEKQSAMAERLASLEGYIRGQSSVSVKAKVQ